MKQKLAILIIFFLIFSSSVYSKQHDSNINRLKETSNAFNQVAKKGKAAVVSISAVMHTQGPSQNPMYDDPFFREFFGIPKSKQKRSGIGSGVIISEDGYILTNHHVIDHATEISITLADGREFDANIVGSDPKTDVALLKIDAKNLPIVYIGDSDALNVGDWSIAVGNPFGLAGTVTVGVISAKGRSGVIDLDNYAAFLQTDAAINPGNSGGALLNIEGELIGINTAIFSRSGGYMGIGFAVPSNLAIRVMEDLRNYGEVRRGLLGVTIQPISDEIALQYNLSSKEGAFVVSVQPGSSADKAGVKANDIIIELGGVKVTDFLSLRSKVSALRIGQKEQLKVFRKGKEKTLSFTLTSNNKFIAKKSTHFDKIGLKVVKNDSTLQQKYNLSTKQGLVITSVKKNSPAYKKRLSEGHVILDINGQTIRSINEYKKIMNKSDMFLLSLNVDGYGYQVLVKAR